MIWDDKQIGTQYRFICFSFLFCIKVKYIRIWTHWTYCAVIACGFQWLLAWILLRVSEWNVNVWWYTVEVYNVNCILCTWYATKWYHSRHLTPPHWLQGEGWYRQSEIDLFLFLINWLHRMCLKMTTTWCTRAVVGTKYNRPLWNRISTWFDCSPHFSSGSRCFEYTYSIESPWANETHVFILPLTQFLFFFCSQQCNGRSDYPNMPKTHNMWHIGLKPR